MTLLEQRQSFGISQLEAASSLGVPVRTYRRYESDNNYGSDIKRHALIEMLKSKYEINEEKGILKFEDIKKAVSTLFDSEEYKGQIRLCYLFGSYAKGYANEKSDIDLMIDTDLTGFKYYGLIGDIKNALHKKIDCHRLKDLLNDNPIIVEILKDGIKIYEQY